MKFRTRIFITTFILSTVLLGTAGIYIYGLNSRSDKASTEAAEKAMLALDSALASPTLRAEDAEAVSAAVIPLRRDLAKRTVLSEDRRIGSLALSIGFLVIEAVAALIVSATLALFLTGRWARLGAGLKALRADDRSWRFSSGLSDEFGMLENQLDELLDALAERERMKTELKALQGWGEAAAFVAHQARTPLASITMSARTARDLLGTDARAPLDREALRDAVARTESEAVRLASLFKRMRSLSGFSEPAMSKVDPEKAFLDAAVLVSVTQAAVTKNRVSTDFSAGCRFPSFDGAYLKEIFINLLTNSAEAALERGQPFFARLASESSAGESRLVYTDGVTGLHAGILEKIGTSRFTTKREGSGLGVWLVGKIASLHGGSLRIDLSGTGGLVFILSFPEPENE